MTNYATQAVGSLQTLLDEIGTEMNIRTRCGEFAKVELLLIQAKKVKEAIQITKSIDDKINKANPEPIFENDVLNRTEWKKVKDGLKVTTFKLYGGSYTNTVKVPLAKILIEHIAKELTNSESIKIPDVVKAKKMEITQKSNYSKSPGALVNRIFQVLTLEQLIVNGDNSFYSIAQSKTVADLVAFSKSL